MNPISWCCVCVCVCMCARARVCTLSCLSRVQLCNPMDHSPQGSSVHGILQARMLEWVVTPSFRGSSQPRDQAASLSSPSPALTHGFFTVKVDVKVYEQRF